MRMAAAESLLSDLVAPLHTIPGDLGSESVCGDHGGLCYVLLKQLVVRTPWGMGGVSSGNLWGSHTTLFGLMAVTFPFMCLSCGLFNLLIGVRTTQPGSIFLLEEAAWR